MVSVVSGFINESSVIEVIPSLAEPITPLNDNNFLVPVVTLEEVKALFKVESTKVVTIEGICPLKLSPWMTELGVDGKATGIGQWVLIWNLLLY